MTQQLWGKPVSEGLLEKVRASLGEGTPGGPSPLFASVHLGTGGPFAFYRARQERIARSVGIGFQDVQLSEAASTEELRSSLRALQGDPTVHGVLVQHPLPKGVDFQAVVDELSPEKDVDGVGSTNLGRLVEGHPTHAPAVALGVLEILRHYSIPTAGQRVAVIGRSSSVGMPLALLLAGRGSPGDATVTVAHSRTPDLKSVLAHQDLIVSCAGAPGLLTPANVPKGSVVVDVGLSSVPDPAAPTGYRAAGDADDRLLDGWVEALSPVPGGVGPVTVAQLMWNVVVGWKLLRAGPT